MCFKQAKLDITSCLRGLTHTSIPGTWGFTGVNSPGSSARQGAASEFFPFPISQISHLNLSYTSTKHIPPGTTAQPKVKLLWTSRSLQATPRLSPSLQKSPNPPAQTNRHICQQLLLIFWNHSLDCFIAKKKKRYL